MLQFFLKLEKNEVIIPDNDLAQELILSTEDLRFADFLVSSVVEYQKESKIGGILLIPNSLNQMVFKFFDTLFSTLIEGLNIINFRDQAAKITLLQNIITHPNFD